MVWPCYGRSGRIYLVLEKRMPLIVQKFGGTSMGSVERIQNVAQRVAKWHAAGYQVIVVPSAMSGETNRLLELAHEISPTPSDREQDMLAATGEQASSALLAMAIMAQDVPARSFTGWQVPVRTNNAYTKARITHIETERIRAELDQGKVVVITGFQGVDEEGHLTTLGRGGSDTSAVAIAAAMEAEECMIFSDVDGVYTTDPRVVPEARRMRVISFEEMLELASLGTKILQIRAVEFAGKYRVPLRVLSSLTDPQIPVEEERKSGTLITFEDDQNMESAVVSGIAFSRDETKFSLLGVPDTPGVAYAILGPVAAANIDVDMILQNQSVQGTTDFSFTVQHTDFERTKEILENEVAEAVGASEVIADSKVCKVSIVGIGMRNHVGIASLMFRTLAEENINIQMISTSEIKTSVIIEDKYMELAVRALHKAFELDQDHYAPLDE